MKYTKYFREFIIIGITLILVFIIFIIGTSSLSFKIAKKLPIKEYHTYFELKNIVAGYATRVYNVSMYKEFSDLSKPKISKKDFHKIALTYQVVNTTQDTTFHKAYQVAKDTYLCEYTIDIMDNEIHGEEANSTINSFYNTVVIRLNTTTKQYKVLYNKFDLGGGNFYEK